MSLSRPTCSQCPLLEVLHRQAGVLLPQAPAVCPYPRHRGWGAPQRWDGQTFCLVDRALHLSPSEAQPSARATPSPLTIPPALTPTGRGTYLLGPSLKINGITLACVFETTVICLPLTLFPIFRLNIPSSSKHLLLELLLFWPRLLITCFVLVQ